MKVSEKIIIVLGILTVLGLAVLITIFTVKTPESQKAKVSLAALQAPTPDQALITFLSGRVYIYRHNNWTVAQIGDAVEAADFVRVFRDSYCEIQFGDRSVISLQENTLVKMSQVYNADTGTDIEMDIKLGTLLCNVNKLTGDSRFRIKSDTSAFGVRGTKFLIQKTKDKTLLAVKEGTVAVTTPLIDSAELLVGHNKQVEIDNKTGNPGKLQDLSALSQSQLELVEKLKLLALKEKFVIELVKIAVVVDPLDAEIYLGGQRVGYGVYAGLFTDGEKLDFTIKHNGYQDKSISVAVKKGEDSEYRVKLKLAEPLAGLEGAKISVDLRALADELQDNIELLKNKLQVTEAEKEKFRKQMQDLNDNLKDLSKHDSDLEVQVKKLSDEKSKLEQDLQAIREEMKSVRTELDQKNELLRSIHEQSGNNP